MTHQDRRNGQGFTYATEATAAAEAEAMTYFPEIAAATLEQVRQTGNCVITAGPGAGKSHLVSDLLQLATSDGQPILQLAAEINGGSKKGVDNALFVLGTFAERHPDGLIAVDNVDFYGYSGSQLKRRYPLALAHIQVANQLSEMVRDQQAPAVIGTAHTQAWRDNHWLYPTVRPDDMVTPQAQALLDSFDSEVVFDGIVSDRVAEQLIGSRLSEQPSAAESTTIIMDSLREYAGDLYFRHVNHLPSDMIDAAAIENALRQIDQGTAIRLGGVMCLSGVTQ